MTRWTVDPAHSQVEFSVKHMMVSTVRGRFRTFSAEVDFDEANLERSSVIAHIDVASIDTGVEARDAHLRSADFFDAARFPELIFRSTAIEKHHGDYRIHGQLTLRGETRPVTLEAELGGVVPGLEGGRRAAFEASTRISRKEWGLNWNVALESGGWLVSDEVKISIELALVSSAEAAEEQVAAEASSEPASVR